MNRALVIALGFYFLACVNLRADDNKKSEIKNFQPANYASLIAKRLCAYLNQPDLKPIYGKIPEKSEKCMAWYNKDGEEIYFLFPQSLLLLRFNVNFALLPEENQEYFLTSDGSWFLRKDISEESHYSSRLELVKAEAKEIVYHCLVDGATISFDKEGSKK